MSELRPQKAARPAPGAEAIELNAGGKLVMTSGGYRTVSSWATVARFRKHVSPLTGVVSRLERIDADLPLNTNYYARHNFSGDRRKTSMSSGRDSAAAASARAALPSRAKPAR